MTSLFTKSSQSPVGPEESLLIPRVPSLTSKETGNSEKAPQLDIYAHLRCRFHTFFLSFLVVLLIRSSFYTLLRFHDYRDMFKTLKLVDNIDPIHSYMMGVEEFLINAILLSYLYGVNGGGVNDEKKGEDMDDELEEHFRRSTTVVVQKTMTGKNLNSYNEPLLSPGSNNPFLSKNLSGGL